MRLAWATDIHLDCVDDVVSKVQDLAVRGAECESFILSGDITIAPHLLQHLRVIESIIQKPFYFVLGNHDYYFSDILSVRKSVADACRSMSFARYLAMTPYVRLTPHVALVGHDGWYDAMNGNFRDSDVIMNDWIRIADFSPAILPSLGGKSINKDVIIKISRAICSASVNHIANGIKAAIRDKNEHVIVVSHVPPFKESYNSTKYGPTNSASILPWYTSKTLGDTLLSAARAYPRVKFTILSGHSHSHYDEYLLNNLNVRVGNSQYGSPQIAGIIDI
jgi:predicted phosphohydrolase